MTPELQRIQILKEYNLYNLLYPSNSLFESQLLKETKILDGTETDLQTIKQHLSKLRQIIPDLMLKIAKVGGKAALNALKISVNKTLEITRSHPKATLKLFLGLLAIIIAYGGSKVIQSYNNHPVIPNTIIEEIITEDDLAGIEFIDSTGNKIDVVYNPETNDFLAGTSTSTSSSNKKSEIVSFHEPIKILSSKEKKSSEYHISDYMADALMSVEKFSPVVYDAKHPNRKITQKDMNNMKLDLTIGYGHKLTRSERSKYKAGVPISKEDAKKLFRQDVKEVENIMNSKLKTLPFDAQVEYSQGFIDGFTSLLFNMGSGNMFGNNTKKESEFWRRLRNCRLDTKTNSFVKNDLDYTLAQVKKQNVILRGHKNRRETEYNIMKQGVGELNPSLYDFS